MKECSDSLPFVLGGKPLATPKKTFAPVSRRDALLDVFTPPSTEICGTGTLAIELMNLLYL